jgi:D-sedoheptulose 7-phosphate isomerase
MSFPLRYREQLLRTMDSIDARKVDQAIAWMTAARDSGRAIFVAGNGGSAATAAHFVCDMVKGASFGKRTRFRIQALAQNLPTLTAYSNDVAYAEAMVEELRNFAQPGDLYMAISGSGNSPNVVRAMEFASSLGCKTIALTGRDGGQLGMQAQLNIHVPDEHMGRIEDAHHIICHMICYAFMDQAELAPSADKEEKAAI